MAETSNIVIANNGDLTIKVIQYDYDIPENDAGERPILKTAYIIVSRQVLQNKSVYFEKLLNPNSGFAEAGKDLVELHDDTVKSIEIWLKCWHGALTPDMGKLPIEELWYALEASHKYDFELKDLEVFISGWWQRQEKSKLNVDELQKLLYPSEQANNAAMFSYVSKRLVYETVGHITEFNPTRHRHHHLRPLVIQQLNAAKNNLKNTIHKGLHEAIRRFLRATCDCKMAGLFAYCKGLDATRVWPVEEHATHLSISEMLDGLKAFRYVKPQGSCTLCTSDFVIKDVVKKTHTAASIHFHGLCLDCMEVSKPKTGCADKDYWMHEQFDKWDEECRIEHGSSTWYYSFMGRREEMQAHNIRQRERRRQRARFDL